jgi:diaminohydroxyphosphoribosylaminopyrimidine deaminase/5-amino-6-(5-phosphoribosylamino)uracil reductase
MVEGFTKHVSTGMPFFILKWAMTLDGKIATRSGDSKWITSEDARALVHDLRDACDAVMVGVGTVIADDPQLTVRVETGRSHRPEGPLKVVVDTTGRIPLTAQLLDPKLASRTLVAVTDRADPAKIEKIRATGAKALVMPEKDGLVDLAALGRELGRRGMVNVLAEGGGTLLASLISGGLADKVYAFIAPKIIGGRAAITPVEGEGRSLVADAAKVRLVDVRTIGGDVLIVGYLGGDNVHGNS